MAVPQADVYDTAQLLNFAHDRWAYVRKMGDGPRWLGLELIPFTGDSLRPALLDDPLLAEVRGALLYWPAAEGILRLLDFFCPLRATVPGGKGCTSGHQKPEAGGRLGCYVTIDDPIGCAEGIVHEVAHQRLHCLGMDLDRHDGTLIENDFEERFFSPIRRDRLRPMSALIHGVYAYTFVLAVDLAVPAGEDYIQVNLPKVRRGVLEVRKNVLPTRAGEAFVTTFVDWATDLVEQADHRLAMKGLPEISWEVSDGRPRSV
jgi:hypothetical protein